MIDYEVLIEAYRRSLTSVLRGFRPGDFTEAFLETWVPDEDEAKSIEGIFEAAAASKVVHLAVKVGAATLGRVPPAALEAMAARFGSVTTSRDGDAMVIEVALDGRTPGADEGGLAPATNSKGTRRTVQGPPVPSASERAAAYDTAIRSIGSFTHEGVADVAGTVRVSADYRGATLEVCIGAEHVIVAARHRGGAGDVPAVLEALCRTIESLPLREAADHGAARLELALRGRGSARVVPGIVSPDNADSRIGDCAGTLRALLAEYSRRAGSIDVNNEFVPPLCAEWAQATPIARETRARSALRSIGHNLGLVEGAISLTTIHGATRVVVALAPEIPAAHRPALLFEIERALKVDLDDGVALYLEEMADKNRLRRLVVTPTEARQ